MCAGQKKRKGWRQMKERSHVTPKNAVFKVKQPLRGTGSCSCPGLITAHLRVPSSYNKNGILITPAGGKSSTWPTGLFVRHRSDESSAYHCIPITPMQMCHVTDWGIQASEEKRHGESTAPPFPPLLFIVDTICTKRCRATGVHDRAKVRGPKCVTMRTTPEAAAPPLANNTEPRQTHTMKTRLPVCPVCERVWSLGCTQAAQWRQVGARSCESHTKGSIWQSSSLEEEKPM